MEENYSMKKLSLISLLVVFALLLAACSSEPPAVEEAPAEQAEAPAEEQAAEEPAEEEKADVEVGQAIEAGESTAEEEPAAEVSEFNEAPMLADMVTAGELPPVEERLPVDVQVVTPVDKVGEYGGTWYDSTWEAVVGNIKMILYDPPIRWKPDYTGYEPGLFKAWEWSDDGTQVTYHLRQGVKWSDGEPFTTADLQFWWEDLATNADYKVVQVPWWGFNSDGSPMEVTFPDEYTLVMKWDKPQWITPYIMAQGFWEWEPMMKPRHYLEQFHPNYTEGTDYDQLEAMSKWWENPDYPVLFAWKTESYTPAERAVYVRNPYYWKVDTEGNQLPYIDRLDVAIVPEEEVRLLEASQGKYNAAFRATTNPTDIPFLLEQAESGGYHLATGWVNGAGGWPCWLINQNYPGTLESPTDADLEIGQVLRDKNFRKGISHAMNRERLIDVAWGGFGTPQQATISPQAWHFASPEGQEVFEQWQQADAEYDVDLANQLLDEAGVTDQDGDGFRDLPSGAPLEIVLDLTDWGGESVSIKATEAFAGDLEAVGIKTIINNVIGTPDNQLRQDQGLYMLRNCHASEVDIWTYPDWLFPLRNNRAWPMEGWWRQTGGEEGWEPEPDSPAARLQAIYDQGLAEPDVNKRHELVWEAIKVHIEEGPFTLGAAGDQPMPVVIANNFCNIPETGVLGPWAPGSPGNKHPEQFWINEGADSCE
jgi:peptide/nickel transport system substrate-binding protein